MAGFLWAKSTASLLNLCAADQSACTGYLEKEGDMHFKRLQFATDSASFEFRTLSLDKDGAPTLGK